MDILAAPVTNQDPRFRERNKRGYRIAHWPIWMFVFFISPGPLTFDLLNRGLDWRISVWFGIVAVATGFAAWHGQLPGTEAKPYILSFTEDKPNPLYRKICYTAAWCDLLTFAALNFLGLLDAVAGGHWHLRQLYFSAYFVFAAALWIFGALGRLPRTKASTKGESSERRYFYATVWAVVIAQASLGLMWKAMPRTHSTDVVKLALFSLILIAVGGLALIGRLPRTRPIAYGEWAISD
jgi:hypothetical protein